MPRPPTTDEAVGIMVACRAEWKFCKMQASKWWLDKSLRKSWCMWMRKAWLGYRYAKECNRG